MQKNRKRQQTNKQANKQTNKYEYTNKLTTDEYKKIKTNTQKCKEQKTIKK